MTTEIVRGRPIRPTVDEEVPFSLDELFFSRTDQRGVILSGNSVFQRISMYGRDELINKPHNIIRHPDMPKAVFWLLWETIKTDEPIGAYVKNRAKDGRYYWVFAIVTPIEGGYLSVRLKPSSALLPVVAQEYKSLLAAFEDSKAAAPSAGAALLRWLGELGFEDYTAFMAAALSEEIKARNQALRREADVTIACFGELVTAAKSLLQQAEQIVAAYARNEYVPLNLQVQASHLGQSGATISVISNSYNLISAEIKGNMNRFIASARDVLKTINSGLFLLCIAKVQQEVAELFRAEIAASDAAQAQSRAQDQVQEMRYLEQQQEAYQQKAIDGLVAINDRAGRFRQDCADMKRLAASLEVTRVMGKMESARLAVAKDGLNELIDDLETFQAAIINGLKEIEVNNQSIQHNARRLVEIMDQRVS